MQLQHPHPNTAGVAPNLAGYPVLSPLRCGSPPRQGYLPSSQQQQFNSPNSRSRRYSRPVQASYPSSEGQQVSPTKGRGQVVPIEAGIAGGCGVQQQQRSASPGAAGLLNAAAVLAAEVEAGRGDAAVLDSRLRFAEDKLLQQVQTTAAHEFHCLRKLQDPRFGGSKLAIYATVHSALID